MRRVTDFEFPVSLVLDMLERKKARLPKEEKKNAIMKIDSEATFRLPNKIPTSMLKKKIANLVPLLNKLDAMLDFTI